MSERTQPPGPPTSPPPPPSFPNGETTSPGAETGRGTSPAPWQNEPNEKRWEHCGYACVILRASRMGHLCGYVGVSREHPAYNLACDEIHQRWEIDIHGGLTFSDERIGREEPDGRWWLGFDCAHGGDLSPWMAERYPHLQSPTDIYRDLAFVTAECERLAAQLAAIAASVAEVTS